MNRRKQPKGKVLRALLHKELMKEHLPIVNVNNAVITKEFGAIYAPPNLYAKHKPKKNQKKHICLGIIYYSFFSKDTGEGNE